MSMNDHIHTSVAPVAGAAVSCVVGFDLHAVLGLTGQIIGIISGLASVAWVLYQMRKATKK
jgi:hypothetical protein